MLFLSRRQDERICIGNDIWLTVIDIRGDKVRLGIDAPRDVPVHREEVQLRIDGAHAATDIEAEGIDE